MLKKLIWLFIAGLLINSLSGCNGYSKEEFKQLIQNGYDKYRIKKNLKGSFCFYTGPIKFPYTLESINEDDVSWKKTNKHRRRLTLDLFTDAGLLIRTSVEGQPELYHYELTELGKEYQHLYVEYYHNGEPYYNNSFCYGVIKVDKVTNIKVENNRKMPYPHKHEVYVDYDYHVEEVPEWVVLNQEKLSKRYDTSLKLEDQKYEEIMRYQGEEDGYLHPFSKRAKYREMRPNIPEDGQ